MVKSNVERLIEILAKEVERRHLKTVFTHGTLV
jgi:hypothetical protein